MEWFEYEGKRIRAVDIENRVYVGLVKDYTSNEDNDGDGEYITVYPESGEWKNRPMGLYPEDVKLIEVLTDGER